MLSDVELENLLAEMEKNGNPPPEFQVEEFHVGVVLRITAASCPWHKKRGSPCFI
ncbi:MAG: hypothetical protein ACP5I8_13180 [Phycisphaerae bacterium]